MAQKFIITNTGHFRFGNVNFHRELLRDGEDCFGGGFYEFDYSGARMLLYGKSYDYGRPCWSLLDSLAVPESLSSLHITYDDVTLSDLIPIKFVPA